MRLGLQGANFTWWPDQGQVCDTFALIAQRAERAGLYNLWAMDDFFQIPFVLQPEDEV